jgi:hypothetical protein
MTEKYAKIVRVGISRYYGFVDASFVEIEWVYANGRAVKGAKHLFLGAYRHSRVGVEYAMFCGIKAEADLYKLEGKKVNVSTDISYDEDQIYTVIGLGRPKDFSKDKNNQPYATSEGYNNNLFWIAAPDTDEETDWDAKFVVGNSY